jgi:hypothetical protein
MRTHGYISQLLIPSSHQPAAAMTSGMMLQHRYTEMAPVIIAIGIVFRDAQQSRVTKARTIANMNLFSIICPPVPCLNCFMISFLTVA